MPPVEREVGHWRLKFDAPMDFISLTCIFVIINYEGGGVAELYKLLKELAGGEDEVKIKNTPNVAERSFKIETGRVTQLLNNIKSEEGFKEYRGNWEDIKGQSNNRVGIRMLQDFVFSDTPYKYILYDKDMGGLWEKEDDVPKGTGPTILRDDKRRPLHAFAQAWNRDLNKLAERTS